METAVERDHLSLAYAVALDAADPLRAFRNRFYLRTDRIYLDGNSLGLASRDAEAAVLAAIEDWKQRGIDGWTSGDRPWFYLAEELGAMQAEVMGARPDEIVVTGSTTVNLHGLVASFYRPTATRFKLVADVLNFSSDIYALQSQIRLRGRDPSTDLVLVASRDGRTIEEADVIAAFTDEVVLAVLPAVFYRGGQWLDLPRITRAAHERGILVGFDCSHSAGSVPHHLHDWNVDFAFWCNYKYLNGGPGAVGSLYVHERHFGTPPGLAGWFGSRKESQFDLALEFDPSPTAGAWQISTPPVLGAAALYGSLRMFQEAGIEAVRAKSLAQTGYLIELADRIIAPEPYGFSVGTPREAARRGGHVALEHPDAVRVCKALKARGIIPDFRYPNVIRLAPIPFYTTYGELWHAVQTIKNIVDHDEHRSFGNQRDVVG